MGVGQSYAVNAIRSRRFLVTVPANASAAVTIKSMVEAVALSTDLPDLKRVLSCKIDGLLSAGGYRPSIIVGDSPSALIQAVAVGVDFVEPTIDEYNTAYVKAAAGGSITATVLLYIG